MTPDSCTRCSHLGKRQLQRETLSSTCSCIGNGATATSSSSTVCVRLCSSRQERLGLALTFPLCMSARSENCPAQRRRDTLLTSRIGRGGRRPESVQNCVAHRNKASMATRSAWSYGLLATRSELSYGLHAQLTHDVFHADYIWPVGLPS